MKLSDFKDEKAVEVVGKLLEPIENIVKNSENKDARGNSIFGFVSAICKNNPNDVKKMLAILSDIPEDEYHCNAVSVIKDAFDMLNDEVLLELFGLQSKTE